MKQQKAVMDRPYFFDQGLRFECTGCGACCTGASGTIFMNDRESREIAAHLGLEHDAFLSQYAYPYKGGHSLTEQANGDCVFLRGKQCGIYEVRPTQCRTFPFWPETLRSEARWRETRAACEGIGRGRVHSREEIMATLNHVLAECHDAEW